MSPAWRRLLNKHKGKTLVELCRRPKIEERISGFVVDFSDDLILLHRLDWNTFSLDGYTLLRDDDIQAKRFYSHDAYWPKRAIEKFKLQSRQVSGLKIGALPETIIEISKKFPLIHVERELRFPGECWIGTALEVTDKLLVLDNLNPDAEWTGPYRIKLGDITRIDFGGGYEKALAATAPKRRASILKKYPPLCSPVSWVKSLRNLRGLKLRRNNEKLN
jgi:hypothetical protein